MKINLVRKPFGFLFATDEDAEKARKIKEGAVVEVNVKVLRNYRFLKKFFAMINTAWEFLNERQQEFFHNSKERFRESLIFEAGFYEEIYSVTLKDKIRIPKSIAFDKMSEEEFDKLYNAVVDVVFRLFLPHVDRDTFYEAMKDF